jgi:(R)-2-hydroxyacyl-CoA dehydratese activating ATPase
MRMSPHPVFAGIDVGSSRTKVAVLDEGGELVGHCVQPSGTNFAGAAESCLASALSMANVTRTDIARTISTGYGRMNASLSNDVRTEIACHGAGCYHAFPVAISVIDIGGQDNKIIKLDDDGRRSSFKMNRKCAAGTGAFLEEMSARLDIPLEDMNDLASHSTDMLKLGSYCTVFTATEVLESIRHGKKVEDIIKGLFYSVIKRVLEMDSLTENVVMTGGVVAHNPYLVTMTEEMIGKKVSVSKYPQFTGAIGAALFAIRDYKENGGASASSTPPGG